MAINLQRSPRINPMLLDKCGTNPDVGPGTYASANGVRLSEQSCVPFQSLQDKIAPNRSTSAMTPGPGSYQLELAADAGKPHGRIDAVFKSRSARMAPMTPGSSEFNHSTIIYNPGPGTYGAHRKWMTPAPKQYEKGQPVLELSKTAASIPQVRAKLITDSEDSQLTSAADRKDSAEFDPQQIRRTRTTNFHVSASSRKLWEPTCSFENELPAKSNPGPGAYLNGRRVDSAPINGSRSVFMSKTPMCHQRVEQEPPELPADSDITRPLGEGCPAAVNTFGSQVMRVGWGRSIDQPYKDPYSVRVPGPGSYYQKEEPIDTEPTKKKIHGVHNPNTRAMLNEVSAPLHAFNTTDIRPCNKKPSGPGNPPPGAYSLDQVLGASMIADIQEKALVGRKGVFGTTADRFFRGQFDASKLIFAESGGVDARNYNPEIHTDRDDAAKHSMMFQSATQRFTDDDPQPREGQPLKHQDPGPMHYFPEKDINYRSPFRHPRTAHLSFGSGRSRFSSRGVFNGVQHTVQPGPGEYTAHKHGKTRGAAKTHAKRMSGSTLGSTTKNVGPGTYELCRSMMKKTFNVS